MARRGCKREGFQMPLDGHCWHQRDANTDECCWCPTTRDRYEESTTDAHVEKAARAMAKWFDGSDKEYRSYITPAMHVVYAIREHP